MGMRPMSWYGGQQSMVALRSDLGSDLDRSRVVGFILMSSKAAELSGSYTSRACLHLITISPSSYSLIRRPSHRYTLCLARLWRVAFVLTAAIYSLVPPVSRVSPRSHESRLKFSPVGVAVISVWNHFCGALFTRRKFPPLMFHRICCISLPPPNGLRSAAHLRISTVLHSYRQKSATSLPPADYGIGSALSMCTSPSRNGRPNLPNSSAGAQHLPRSQPVVVSYELQVG
ncbi:hypothetical protein EDB86DRAFT_2982611 [Lactarius hatsudake]|nr:hypothetical protein EDB86DRAFT_2982611 [Lactarius hatsudake]